MLAATLALALALVVPAAAPAAAGETTSTTVTTAPPAPDIIPRPNQGVAPEDPGDRGGSLQTLVFVLIIGSVAGIGVVVVRQSRRARSDRGF